MGCVGAPGLWTKCMTVRGSFGNRFLVDVGCGGVIEYGSILLYLFGEGDGAHSVLYLAMIVVSSRG